MASPPSVTQWTQLVATQLPHLSRPQATVLAWWSLGMVLARSCGLTAVSAFVASLQHRKENTVRQQLREWCYEATAKRGAQRQTLAVEACFAPLLRWVLQWWHGPQLALALDATTLGDRLWSWPSASSTGAVRSRWPGPSCRPRRPDLESRMATLAAAVAGHRAGDHDGHCAGGSGAVCPLAVSGHCPPGVAPPATGERGRVVSAPRPGALAVVVQLRPPAGTRWQGAGTAFKTAPVPCTLLACWEPAQAERWLLVTDLPPTTSTAAWYGLRAWIEQGFKLTKRGGWQWQRTRMTHPARAARLWLAVAVATLWLVSVGGVAEDAIASSTVLDVTAVLGAQRRQRRATRLRLVSVFRRGWITILVALLRHEPLPPGRLQPEPWPALPGPAHGGADHAF